jgi:hypothetical protein
MDCVSIASVEPHLKSVAVLDSRNATPGRLFLSDDPHVEGHPIVAPGGSNVGKNWPAFQFAKAGKHARLGKLNAVARPGKLLVMAGRLEAKQQGWR